MRRLLEILNHALPAGESLALCTVVARSGSAPRGAGARMLSGAAGRLWGTVGGGLIERRAEELAAQVLASGQGLLRSFSLNGDGPDDLDMVCGGGVTLAVQYLPGGDPELAGLAETASAWLREGRDGWLVSPLEGDDAPPLALLDPAAAAARYPDLASPAGEAVLLTAEDGVRLFAQRLARPGTVYLFGGGHVARELAPLLARLDFRYVVADDRPAFSRPEDFPGAARVLQIDFGHILEVLSPARPDYAVVMTHGHLFDLAVQAQLLTTPVGYIGVMGSRKKRDFVFGRLREAGFSSADLERVVTPVGLPLGGGTPAEIALSIAAQLVMLRAGKDGGACRGAEPAGL